MTDKAQTVFIKLTVVRKNSSVTYKTQKSRYFVSCLDPLVSKNSNVSLRSQAVRKNQAAIRKNSIPIKSAPHLQHCYTIFR